jgi:hypothetical protein
MTDKPTSLETDQPLISGGVKFRIPNFRLPEFQGLGLGIGLVAGALVLGLALFQYLPSPMLRNVSNGTLPDNFLVSTLVYMVDILVADVVPLLIGLIMLWVAFVRVDARDRYLWSAVMIVSSDNVASILNMILSGPALRFVGHAPSQFINAPMVTGLIAYGALHFALAREERKPTLASIAVVALAVLVLLPLAIGWVSWASTICSLLLAMGLWAIGVWIAQRVGFDVYASDEALPAES